MTPKAFDRTLPWLVALLLVAFLFICSSACPVHAADRVFTAGRIAHLALQSADTATTVYALRSHIGQEGNPLVGGLTNHAPVFVAVKTAVAVTLDYALRKGHAKHRRLTTAAVWALTAGYAVVVTNNVRVIRGVR